ncbi:MAG: 4Fe-4S dicluster domain-containing protein [Bacteroidales bacterium]|nr:4Fe-4S dicluster domain-containing protein [Bacteroidales bacterium]
MKLRKLRVALAIVFSLLITLLFLDFTGTLHAWFSWLASIQLVPAILASNFIIVIALLVITFLFGRTYCSVLCPLGVFQDSVCWINRKAKKYPYHYRKPLTWLRIVFLVIMAAGLILAIPAVYTILDPYSTFGQMASNLFAPVYKWINNLFAGIAEHYNSYAFYHVDVWVKVGASFVVAVIFFVGLYFANRKWGRIYCNAVCPVGTFLGFISRFSIYKPVIDTDKCVNCTVCEKKCKASCINSKEHKIDYSRCVVCMDCLDNCTHDAIHYVATNPFKKNTAAVPAESDSAQKSRRTFLTVLGLSIAGAAKAQTQNATEGLSKIDGGIATLLPKQAPARGNRIVPPGAQSLKHLSAKCTACGLCISSCKNHVLRPSSDLSHFMQPEMSFEKGYCRPECHECSVVCPSDAIKPITVEEKSSIQIGHAVWNQALCVVLNDSVECGNCATHCPNGAIVMVPTDPSVRNSLKIPTIDEARCIGCGTCEYVCPARPISAIHVEGHDVHKFI